MSRRKLLINLTRLRDENEFQILPTAEFSVHTFKNELDAQKVDKILRNRYLYIFLNGLIGVALMIIELQLSWNEKEIIINSSTKAIRIVMFILNLILLCQLMDYYRLLLSNWGLLMWLRIYMFARVYRDFSHVYKSRHSLASKYRAKNEVPPKFNWALSLKTLLYQRPLMTFIPFTTLIIFICSHIIYVFEREALAGFSYAVSLYISFISMATGWPTDTYDIYNPSTFFGRFGAIMSSVLGLFTLACLIEQFSNLTHPTAHQKPILNYIYLLECQERERNSAAKLIQVVWKRHRWQHSHSFSANRTVYNTQEAYFCMKYIEAVKNFGRERRYKKQIRALVSSDRAENEDTADKTKEVELKQMLETEKKARIAMETKLKTIEEYNIYISNQLNLILHNQQSQFLQQINNNNICWLIVVGVSLFMYMLKLFSGDNKTILLSLLSVFDHRYRYQTTTRQCKRKDIHISLFFFDHFLQHEKQQ
ncbi:hypothetical protein PPL_03986 [Heterostelium album PN500]|uniref:Potassium channel domain-containing protein n=1 Tax=Heterostelium pallidum (strain ATCC 26659 / Pp 5 / PN500) TaxID=670386 RepID=D3B5P8_HETP5|nr:hypothetical protein PPL_03986 [Heterostelium album PN500]EFA83196.1 hypothetical protein PPL_03986 [Heterostelium album PN500]|eukprot:XP_020435313.1 hypothetical protein PPL_03986 [Heterostelium album PN500]